MPVEHAYFTPKTRSGKALFLDIWNADLFDGQSHLAKCNSDDVIQDRKSLTTWKEDFNTGNPNGWIQAIFEVDEGGYYSVSSVLSSDGTSIHMFIDGEQTLHQWIDQDGEIVVGLAYLAPGTHSVTIKHGPSVFWVSSDLWFHSLTIFKY